MATCMSSLLPESLPLSFLAPFLPGFSAVLLSAALGAGLPAAGGIFVPLAAGGIFAPLAAGGAFTALAGVLTGGFSGRGLAAALGFTAGVGGGLGFAFFFFLLFLFVLGF